MATTQPPHIVFRNHVKRHLLSLVASTPPSAPLADTDTKTSDPVLVADKPVVTPEPSPADGAITPAIAAALLGLSPVSPDGVSPDAGAGDSEAKTTTDDTTDDPELAASFQPYSTGYPSGQFYVLLADRMVEWVSSGVLPLTLPPMDGCVEVITAKELLTARKTALFSAYDAVMTSSDAEAGPHVGLFLDTLGVAGLHCFLGMRRTVGTVPHLPPPRNAMMAAFHLKWKAKARITVGARALTKHSHRSSEEFWGVSKGSEAVKNEWATGVVETILNDAVWINCHTLPHDELVVEMRVAAGYGARWRIDGSMFRGFLEPQMSDGHEKGWRH